VLAAQSAPYAARSAAIAKGIAETLRPEDSYLILRASNHNADRALEALRRELEARGRTAFLDDEGLAQHAGWKAAHRGR
jgi:hypothetical protein